MSSNTTSPNMGGSNSMMGNSAPMMGNSAPMIGGNTQIMGGNAPMMGGNAPMMGGNAPMMGGGMMSAQAMPAQPTNNMMGMSHSQSVPMSMSGSGQPMMNQSLSNQQVCREDYPTDLLFTGALFSPIYQISG